MDRPQENPRALEALASPVRQELVAALGEGPATVRELAARLGRTRQALYHHVALLERAGLIRQLPERGGGDPRERRYALVTTRLAVRARRSSPAELGQATRATEAMLRLTAREVGRALRSKAAASTGAKRTLVGVRAKVRLGPSRLRRLNGLIDQLIAFLSRSDQDGDGVRIVALTLVLTPAGVSPETRTARARRRR